MKFLHFTKMDPVVRGLWHLTKAFVTHVAIFITAERFVKYLQKKEVIDSDHT